MLAPLLSRRRRRRGMDDVLRWVATEEEAEVLDLLDRAGVSEAVDAARSTFAKEERQRSSITTTLETLLEPFVGAAPWGGRAVRRRRPPGRGRHALPVCAGPRSAPADPAVRSVLRRCSTVYDRVARTGRPLDPPLCWCSTKPPTSRRCPTSTRWRRPRRPRDPAGDRLARPGPDHRPVRSPGDDGGQQPPGQAVPLGDLGPGDARLRQPPHRGRGGADATTARRADGSSTTRSHLPSPGPAGRNATGPPAPGSSSTGTCRRLVSVCAPYFEDPHLAERAAAGCVTP